MALYWVTAATTAAPTAAFDAVELAWTAAGLLLVKRVMVWQTSDLGDAQEEVLRSEWVRGNTTTGSGGVTTVVTPLNSRDGAAGVTAKMLNTTTATAGSPVSLGVMGWNIRIPLDVLYPPGQEIVARNSERICFRCSAPADAITVNAACLIEEL